MDAALGKAAKKIEAEYYIPHLAQAPMEPPAATVRIKDGKCDVWTCVQAPRSPATDVAERLGMKFEDVTVHVTLLGGGFGRKSKPDFAIEAALLSKEMGGAPVKLLWTREDDIRHGYYHTVSAERIEAGMDAAGKPVAWRHRSVAPSIVSIFAPDPKHEGPFELGMGLVDVPFDIPNLRCENGEAEAHARIGWFRSVSNIPHAFAIQSFAAEMAHAAGKDQKDYLLELMGPARVAELKSLDTLWNYGESTKMYPVDVGRLRHVVELVVGKGRLGPQAAGAARPGHRGPPKLRDLCRDGGRDGGGGGRHGIRAPDRRGDRLRQRRQSRPRPRPDRRGVHHGPEPRLVERDQLQGWPRRSGQLRRLSWSPGSIRPRVRSTSTSCRRTGIWRPAASVNRACLRWRRP